MKKFICILLSVCLFSMPVLGAEKLYYNEQWHTCDENVSVMLDGEIVDFDVSPFIDEGRTMIPVRGLFEKCGAQVSWDGEAKCVSIETADCAVLLVVDLQKAFLNGKIISLSHPARLVTDQNGVARTVLPLRDVSEAFGYQVDWDDEARIASITTKIQETPVGKDPEITTVAPVIPNGSGISVVSETMLSVPGAVILKENDDNLFHTFILKNGSDNLTDGIGNGAYIDKWTVSDGILTVYTKVPMISYAKDSVIVFERNAVIAKLSYTPDQKAKNLLVAIDAGHGGTDPGALGKDKNGNIDLEEKDVNLDIAKMVDEILQNAGIKTLMTRTTDTYVGLQERADIANEKKAAVFVSTHCNSFTSDSASGSLVYCYSIGNPKDKFTGETLAKCILDEIEESLKLPDHGVVAGNRYVVINQTDMPAVIVESAFLSNEKDKAFLSCYEGRLQIATAIANGIIKSLNLLCKNA